MGEFCLLYLLCMLRFPVPLLSLHVSIPAAQNPHGGPPQHTIDCSIYCLFDTVVKTAAAPGSHPMAVLLHPTSSLEPAVQQLPMMTHVSYYAVWLLNSQAYSGAPFL
jgi:hypothetical protein